MGWDTRTGEIFLARGPVEFATGTATPVSEMRWFRDHERRDIQHELAGWPEGPIYAVRSRKDRNARRFGHALLVPVEILFALVLNVLSLGGGDSTPRGKPEDPDNEIEDFPVLWAQPGGIARALPWQLDPSRRPKDYQTHAVVTDQRLVIVGFPDQDTSRDQELFAVDRAYIAAVRRQRYSPNQRDVRVDFTDGSWCRLYSRSAGTAERFIRHLEAPPQIVPEEHLSPGQRAVIAELLSEEERFKSFQPACYTDWIATRRPSGNVYFEAWADKADPYSGTSGPIELMAPNGRPVFIKPAPGDFASPNRLEPPS